MAFEVVPTAAGRLKAHLIWENQMSSGALTGTAADLCSIRAMTVHCDMSRAVWQQDYKKENSTSERASIRRSIGITARTSQEYTQANLIFHTEDEIVKNGCMH